MSETITLKRTNQRPLCFVGERIAEASTLFERGIKHEASVYQHKSGYVLAYSRYSQWQGEIDTHEAWRRRTREEIADLIEEKANLDFAEWPTRLVDKLINQLGVTERLDGED